MRGAQSPGGGRSRDRGRRVYTVRRVLAILLLLLLLALIIPRACQAITGSDEDTAGSGGDRGARAPEKAAGGGAGVAEGDEGARDEDASDGKGKAGGDKASVVKDTGGQDDEGELGTILTEAVADRGTGGTGSDEDVALGGGAEQPAPTAEQPPVAGGAGPSSTAAPMAPMEKPPPEPAPEPRARSKTGPAASGPAPTRRAPKLAQGPTGPLSVSKPTPGPAQISRPRPGPIAVASVQPRPVAAAPVQPAVNNTAFAGGGAVGPPVNNAAAFSGPARGGFATGGSFAGVRGSF